MMSIEPHTPHQQSLLKRSTSIWRRFSKRERPTISPHLPTTTNNTLPSNDTLPSNNPLKRSLTTHKLRKHVTETSMRKNITIADIQRVDMDAPKKRERERERERVEPANHPPARVLPISMQTTPFPHSSRTQTAVWNVFLTPEQVFSLFMGFRPTRMEDKWFIYSEGPDKSGKLKVHFHRSWTGLKIAELFVVVDWTGLGAGKIVGIKWNRSEQTNGISEAEVKYMISMTCAWTLGVNIQRGF